MQKPYTLSKSVKGGYYVRQRSERWPVGRVVRKQDLWKAIPNDTRADPVFLSSLDEAATFLVQEFGLKFKDETTATVHYAEEDEYIEPLDEQGDVFTLLEIGDKVETPDGPGEVVSIALHGADYGDRSELEPPAIIVELEDGTETTVCPCAVELEDEEMTELLHTEYERLWPPIEELPGDAQRLIDDEKLEQHRESLNKRYMLADEYATHTITAAGPLIPGMVLEDLEGVELGKGAMVLEVDMVGDKQTVKLYFPETEDIKTVKVPLDSEYRSLDLPSPKVTEDKVYDTDVLEVGQPEGLIRWVPDSYIPRNPNYPSTLTDMLSRPTYRQYLRWPGSTWASTTEKNMRRLSDYGSAYDPETAEQDDPFATEPDWFDFPQITEMDVVEEGWDPDLQPSPERLYENPIALFDPEKSPKKMFDTASDLWQEYQTYRHKKVPGVTWSHENMPFEDYCFIFAQDHDLTLEDMNELWDYMEQIGFMTMRERRQWDEALKQDELLYRLQLYKK